MNTLHSLQLLAIPLLPLLGAIMVGFMGSRFSGDGIRNSSVIHVTAILHVLLSCLLSFYTLWQVLEHNASFNQTVFTWLQLGDINLEIGFLIDALSAIMMCVVTFISLMVHIYTVAYMHDDKSYARFFSYISLFTFAMLMLVMSNNLLQLFFGWEAVGVVSYLLIGFWFSKKSAIYANLKAFLVNRVGDLGFILGILLITHHTSSMNYTEIFMRKHMLLNQYLPGTDFLLISAICICLFIGAMGKSAQFPLHVWLPDSMEGPTPISALIHAATMVTAGIFMISRLSPLFEMSDAALSYILVTGSITALFMGFLGLVQTDIKRVVAYSTLSQLGYMTVALGASAYPMAIFHLFTHAFFKALLFLGAGSVILGCHHNQDMRYMGNLKRYMPITHITALLGSLALIGMPFFSGFYSKDGILESLHHSHIWGAEFARFALLAGVFITALYSFRMYFLVFHGKERYHQDPHVDAHHGLPDGKKPHESNIWVTGVLVALCIPSVFIGAWSLNTFVHLHEWQGIAFKTLIHVDSTAHTAMHFLTEEFNDWYAVGIHGFSGMPFILAIAGVLTAWYLYLYKPGSSAWFSQKFSFIEKIWQNKYYLDDFNHTFFTLGGIALAKSLWHWVDQTLIDGFLVQGVANIGRSLAKVLSGMHSGYLSHYILMMTGGLIIALMSMILFL